MGGGCRVGGLRRLPVVIAGRAVLRRVGAAAGACRIPPGESSVPAGGEVPAELACPGFVAAVSPVTPPTDTAAVTAAIAVARLSRRKPWSRRTTAASCGALRVIRCTGPVMRSLCSRRLGVL